MYYLLHIRISVVELVVTQGYEENTQTIEVRSGGKVKGV